MIDAADRPSHSATPAAGVTHNTTFSSRFALPNFGHPFMFARHLDQR